MSDIILCQRIIRSKGSKCGTLKGKVREFRSLDQLAAFTRKARWCMAYLAESGEGVMRSGRKMRSVDLNVRNTVSTLKL